MKKCKKCENTIPTRVYLEGKLILTKNRLYCFDCSPFKQHNLKQTQTTPEKPVMNTCRVCEKEYPGDINNIKTFVMYVAQAIQEKTKKSKQLNIWEVNVSFAIMINASAH